MSDISNAVINFPRESKDPLLAVLHEGARKLLCQALEQEVEDYIAMFASRKRWQAAGREERPYA